MNKILLSFIFAVLCVSIFGITNVQASSFTLNTRDFLQSERPGFDTTYSQIDTSSPVFKTRFLKSTESGCASSDSVGDDGVFAPNSKNIAINKIKARIINSAGSKTNLSITNSDRVVPFSRNDNECSVQYVHEVSIDSSSLKNLSEGLYTFEICVDDICTQVPNVRLKNPSYFEVAYYPSYNTLKEYDFSIPSTKVNMKSPNIKLPGESSPGMVMFKRYIGQQNNYSQMYSFNAIPTTAGGMSPSTRYPSYWELQSNLQGAGSVDNYFPNITDELKGYKDGTYEIMTCLSESHIDYFNTYIKDLPRNTDVFCGSVDITIKNSPGNKTVGGDTVPYEVVNIPTAPIYTYTRDLTIESIGEDVSNLQWFLFIKDFLTVSPTGYFGPLTKQALINYQRSVSITPANGVFNSSTRTSVMSDRTVPPPSRPFELYVPTDPTTPTIPNPPATSQDYTLTITTEGTGSGVVSGSVGSVSSSGSKTFAKNTFVGLYATPNSDSTFSGWSGGKCAGIQSPSCAFTITGNSTEKAVFTKKEVTPTTPTTPVVLPTYTISAIKDGTGNGTISGTGIFEKNFRINLLATPNSDSVFTGWVGGKCARSTAATCSITVDGNSTEKAVFTKKEVIPTISVVLPSYVISTVKEGTGSGTVSGSGTFQKNSVATLTATPDSNSVFTGWSGGKCGGTNSSVCFVSVDRNSTEKAVFTKKEMIPTTPTVLPSYVISTVKEGTGSGTVYGAGTFLKGSRITLTAAPNADSVFTRWVGGACEGTNSSTCFAVVDRNSTEKAVFTKKDVSSQNVTLTITKRVKGNVVNDKINCGQGDSCTATYKSGDSVTLTATPIDGAKFDGWGGVCFESPYSPTCTFVMDANKMATPSFSTIPTYKMQIQKTGTGTGTVYTNPQVEGLSCGDVCTKPVRLGTYVNFVASPAAGSRFTGWSGYCSGATTCSIGTNDAYGNKTVIANFELQVPVGTSSSDNTIYSTLDLEIGMAHPSVATLQKYLNSNGYIINTKTGEEGSVGYETNYFGEKTKQALIKFQKDKGISPAQGFFGPQTRKAMGM